MTNMQKLLTNALSALLMLSLAFFTFSCSEELLDQSDAAPTADVVFESKAQSCGTNDFNAPAGPSSVQSCSDLSAPINVGVLDCRATTPRRQATAGYREFGGRGVYTIYGGYTTDTRRSVRIERRFPNYARGRSKYATFTARFRVDDISKGHTYIAQTHGSKNVVGGTCNGKKHTSAMYLLRIEPKPGSTTQYDVFIEETTVPYTQEGGTGCTGDRTGRRREPESYFRTLNLGQEYTLRVDTGYDSNQNAFTNIKIGGSTYRIAHKFNTQEMYFRYGAYSAYKSGTNVADRKVVVRFKDTRYCHPS